MRNMTTKFAIAIGSAALLGCQQAQANQVAQECFLHSKTHGSLRDGTYESDLVELKHVFDPATMELSQITGYLHKSGALGGIQLTHANRNNPKEQLQMQKIGGGSREQKIALMGQPVHFISIVSTNERVCNIYFGTGDGKDVKLDQSGECDIEDEDGVNLFANVLSITTEYPLVGLHGTVDPYSQWIIDLGVIWLDTKNPECRYREMILDEEIRTADEALNNISEDTLQKGFDLEELMSFHSLIQDQWKQDEIKKQISESSNADQIVSLIKDLDELEEFQEYKQNLLTGDADAIKDRLDWINDDMQNLDMDYLVQLALDLEEAEDNAPETPNVVEKSTTSQETISTMESVFTAMIVFGFFFAMCSGGLCAAFLNKRCLKPVKAGNAPKTEAHTIDMPVIGASQDPAAAASGSGSGSNKNRMPLPRQQSAEAFAIKLQV